MPIPIGTISWAPATVFCELVTCGKMVQKREKGFEIKYIPTEEENPNKTEEPITSEQ